MSTPAELLELQQQQILQASSAFTQQSALLESQQQQIEELQRILVDLQSRSVVVPPSSPPINIKHLSSGLRPPKPNTFDGKHITQAQNFILELEQYFRVVKCEEEEIKYNFAASCLRDNAANWWKTVYHQVSTFEEFKNQFMSMYSPIVITDTARQMIYTLRQNEDVQKYNSEFLGWIYHLQWTEDDKMFVYRQGLKRYIRNRLMNKNKTTLLEDMSSALQIEIELNNQQRFERNAAQPPNNNSGSGNNFRGGNKFTGRGGGRGGSDTRYNNNRGNFNNNNRGGYNSNFNNRSDANNDSVPMELGNIQADVNAFEEEIAGTINGNDLYINRLSPERLQEYKAGLCFYCKEKGHIKKDCPKVKGKPNF